jgi:hypothetical protein
MLIITRRFDSDLLYKEETVWPGCSPGKTYRVKMAYPNRLSRKEKLAIAADQ